MAWSRYVIKYAQKLFKTVVPKLVHGQQLISLRTRQLKSLFLIVKRVTLWPFVTTIVPLRVTASDHGETIGHGCGFGLGFEAARPLTIVAMTVMNRMIQLRGDMRLNNLSQRFPP